MATYQADQWRRLGRALFTAAGATESNAAEVTDSLVNSSLVGHDSHGIIRFVQYIKAVEAGQIDPAAQPEVVMQTPGAALVDGKWTFGQVAGAFCMRKAIEMARSQGIAMCALNRAYHIGRLGEYSDMANKAGMIGMVVAGGLSGAAGASDSGVAPHGGAKAAFGTNPITFGIPAGEENPVMVDYATSAVAGGKISFSRAKGAPLPPNSILDRDGNPSTNPEDFYNGGVMLPFGGHKGYGLAVVIELLGQALTGADAFAGEQVLGGTHRKAGSVYIAINPGVFRPFEEFGRAADATIKRIKAVPPAPGFDEVLLPGEPERRNREKRLVEGILMPDKSWSELHQLAAKYGLNPTNIVEEGVSA